MPIILSAPGTLFWDQVRDHLIADTDPAVGLVPALGQGANSVYPNYETNGPSSERELCPTPFVLSLYGGSRATDRLGRELRLHLEVHDDPNQGDIRWPGLLARLKQVLIIAEWRLANDTLYRYTSGLYFESESPLLPDERYHTNAVRLTVCARAMDRTSGRGYGG
jgi:hypothetical protein